MSGTFSNPEDYSPVGGISTWRGVKSKLERKASKQKIKDENPQPEEV